MRAPQLREQATRYLAALDASALQERKEAMDFFHDISAPDILGPELWQGSPNTRMYAIEALQDMVAPGDIVMAEMVTRALQDTYFLHTGGTETHLGFRRLQVKCTRFLEYLTGLSLMPDNGDFISPQDAEAICKLVEEWASGD